jgi:carboxymethylenebutenolidase
MFGLAAKAVKPAHRLTGLKTGLCAAIWILRTLSPPSLTAAVRAQQVSFRSGSETIAGYLAAPESPGRHPALLVIHDDWGLTGEVKEQTRKLAGEGYVALAVDLYRGEVAYDPSLAFELMVNTPPDRALRDLKAALDFLAARPDVNKDKMGTLGWGMGGKFSLLLAIRESRLAACVLNYGSLPTVPADIQKIHAPVLGIFGADDRSVPTSSVEAFKNAMDSAHKSLDIKIYPGASHGFDNPGNKLGYREGQAEDAWQRTIAFLADHLK